MAACELLPTWIRVNQARAAACLSLLQMDKTLLIVD